ncbi:MAG: hypothetical protein HC900_10700 [Methylacidiphilales bacterium]|nr:hypothetical protein [Candidatus Methylacidiphilales bacterium]
MRTASRWIAAAVVFLTCAVPITALAQSQPAAASGGAVSLSIPPQPLSQALMQFSRSTGIQLFFNADLVRGLQSPGVQGTFSRTEALSRLLGGSGLSFRFTNGSTVTITRPGTAAVATAGECRRRGDGARRDRRHRSVERRIRLGLPGHAGLGL